jgi:hypothetical protein
MEAWYAVEERERQIAVLDICVFQRLEQRRWVRMLLSLPFPP